MKIPSRGQYQTPLTFSFLPAASLFDFHAQPVESLLTRRSVQKAYFLAFPLASKFRTAVGVHRIYDRAPFEFFPHKAAELRCCIDLANWICFQQSSIVFQLFPRISKTNLAATKETKGIFVLPVVHVRRPLWSGSTVSSNSQSFLQIKGFRRVTVTKSTKANAIIHVLTVSLC